MARFQRNDGRIGDFSEDLPWFKPLKSLDIPPLSSGQCQVSTTWQVEATLNRTPDMKNLVQAFSFSTVVRVGVGIISTYI